MNETSLTIVGNVATDVRPSTTPSGVPVASFRLASSSRRFDRATGAWRDGETTFVTVTCWRGLAENVAACVAKGDPVVVQGRLKVRSWEKDERSGITVEVDAITVGHDLSRGTAMFRPVRRSAAETAGGAGTPETPEVSDEQAA